MPVKWKPGNLSSEDSGTQTLCNLFPGSVPGLPFPALIIVSINVCCVLKWEEYRAVHTGPALRGANEPRHPLVAGDKRDVQVRQNL